MSIGATITFDDPAKFPPLMILTQGVQRPEIRKVMGRAITKELREHFSRLDEQRPNAMGGKRTHFWGQMRRSVQQPELIGGDGIKIAINHVAAAQKFFGGDIEPVNKQWLTVPARTEAYGHRAGEFNDLHFVFFRAGLAGLVQNEQTTIELNQNRKKDRGIGPIAPQTTGGGIFYWLVKHVHQEADPTVLEPETSGGVPLQQAALTAGEDYLTVLTARAEEGRA